MKHLTWFALLQILILSCNKEKDGPNSHAISGKLQDASTGAPMPNVLLSALTVEGTYTDVWNGTLWVNILASDKTKDDGSFKMEYPAQSDVSLGCATLPQGYQNYARVGQGIYRLLFDPDDFTSITGSRILLLNRGYYDINIFPVAHYFFKLPVLTPAQKLDTLVLRLENPLDTNNPSVYHYYLLNSTQSVSTVRELIAASSVKGTYELRKDTLIKSGTIDVLCAPHDTTAVPLEF